MPATDAAPRRELSGSTRPRLAPPEPVNSPLLREYLLEVERLRLPIAPWQIVAARYMTATSGERWLYPEFAGVVARQNGKTTLLKPRIMMGLRRREQIIHTAQNKRLPRNMFRQVASAVLLDPELGETATIRRAAGQEEIELPGGGSYKIFAPSPAATRGESADLVIIDEVREQRDQDLMDAILPTITARPNAQIVYLSNAGDDDSIVLNELKARGEQGDPTLAYLEWSAAPERSLDDEEGWAQANPLLGHGDTITIEKLRSFRRSRPPGSFETEHMCRWVTSMLPGFLPAELWERQRAGRGTTPALEAPSRPFMAIAVDPSGRRASVCLAWAQTDGSIALQLTDDVDAEAGLDIGRLGKDLRNAAARVKVRQTGFDPETDGELAKHLRVTAPVVGRAFTAASLSFVQAVQAGRLRWQDDSGVLTSDLGWTARHIDADDGTYYAMKTRQDRPITAVLAAIRAVSLATGGRPPTPRVY